MHYHMPPTDPRFLDARPSDIMHDLMVIMARNEALGEQAGREAVERMADDPEAVEALEERGRAFHGDAGTQRALAALFGASDATGRAPVPATMRMRGPTSTPPE